MTYSVDQLPTVADCDFLLSTATRDRADLAAKLYTISRKRENTGETADSLDGEIAATEAQLTAYQNFVPTLPAGKAKEDAETQIVNLTHRLYLLNKRSKSFGIIAAIELEYNISVMEETIAVRDVLIAAVEARKAAL